MSEALKLILRHPEFPRGKCWEEDDYSPGQTILQEGETSSDVDCKRSDSVGCWGLAC